jgi:hypothetical protein
MGTFLLANRVYLIHHILQPPDANSNNTNSLSLICPDDRARDLSHSLNIIGDCLDFFVRGILQPFGLFLWRFVCI